MRTKGLKLRPETVEGQLKTFCKFCDRVRAVGPWESPTALCNSMMALFRRPKQAHLIVDPKDVRVCECVRVRVRARTQACVCVLPYGSLICAYFGGCVVFPG